MDEVTPADLVSVARRATFCYLRKRPTLAWQTDDMLADAMLAAHIAHQKWDGREEFSAFAYGRCVYAIIDGFRLRGHRNRRDYATNPDLLPQACLDPLSLTDEDLARLDVTDPYGEDSYRCVETRMTTCKALECLCAREREIILRVDLNGEMQADVGRDMGISEARVCQLRKVALKHLRDNPDVREALL